MNKKNEQDDVEKNRRSRFKRKEKEKSFAEKFKEMLKSNSKLSLVFSIGALVVIPCLIIGTSVAKYIRETKVDMAYNAKKFYFESDLLNEDDTLAEYDYVQGIDSITFYLKNNADSLRYSEVDINYTVTLTKEGTVVDTKSGLLTKDSAVSTAIQFENLEAGEYIVTAEAISPYTKTLTGKFNLEEKDTTLVWDIVDSENRPTVELTVTSEGYEGLITINYPTGTQPDDTDEKLETITSTYVTSNFVKHSSYTYTFFKNNPTTVFSKDSFSVTKVN